MEFNIFRATIVAENFIAISVDELIGDFAEFICQSLSLHSFELALRIAEVIDEFIHGIFWIYNVKVDTKGVITCKQKSMMRTLFEYIYGFYNAKRPHFYINFLSPNDF